MQGLRAHQATFASPIGEGPIPAFSAFMLQKGVHVKLIPKCGCGGQAGGSLI